MMRDVLVIGGGISGLTAAYDLMRRGLDVAVLERQVVTGGKALSSRFGGYLMEHGPSTLNVSAADALARLQDLDLLDSAGDLGPNVRKRYLVDRRGLQGISTSPAGFMLSNYLSLPGRISMAAEVLRPRKKDSAEESIFDFSRRRFGAEFAQKVIDPMAAGLFMGDSRALSIEGAFPKLPEMEQRFGSVVRGVLRAKKNSEPGRKLYSWAGGIGTIPKTLTRLLGDRVQTGVVVTGLAKIPGGFRVQTATGGQVARAVVLAVQPHVVADLLHGLEPLTAAAAAEIPAPAIGVVYLGYRTDQIGHPLDGLGFLSTRNAGKTVSGAQFCSTMFQGRAPAGHVSISCYTGGARHPEQADMPDAELEQKVQAELAGLLDIKGPPVLVRTRRWAVGLPQYTLGHRERRAVLETAHERLEGLYLTGNYLQGVSVSNCMASAGAVAAQVGDYLAANPQENPTEARPASF